MGTTLTHHRCLETQDINDILDKKRGCLTVNEVECLYKQFDFVIMQMNKHNHKECMAKQTCPYIFTLPAVYEVVAYKRIAVYHGDVIAFRMEGDTLPCILFKVNNHKFEGAVEIVKQRYTKKQTMQGYSKDKYDYKVVSSTEESSLLIKVVSAIETKSYGKFHWVIDVTM